MNGRFLTLSIIASFRDRVSGPLGRIQRQFARIQATGKRIGALGGIMAGLSFALPLQSAIAYENQLREIAVTAGLSGQAATEFVARQTDQYNKLALAVGQANTKLAEGAGALIAAGMDSALIEKIMPTVGKVATAASAEVGDVAKTAFALNNTLKITEDRMEAAMGKLVTGGKLGRFEFKDVAKVLPELSAHMEKLGVTGEEAVSTLAASLQIAMYGTDSTDTAANNLKNFLSQITSPSVIKSFADAGVDLTAVMADATAKGINPIEAVLQKVSTLTKIPASEIETIMAKARAEGKSTEQAMEEVKARIEKVMGASELGKLFHNIRVLDFLIPMMAHTDKYLEYKKKVSESGAEIIDTDFQTMMEGDAKKLQGLTERLNQFQQMLGRNFANNIGWATAALDKLMEGLTWLEVKFPGLTSTVMTAVGGFLMVGAAIAALTPVFTALGAVLGLVFSPLGLIVAGIAAIAYGAYLIYENWDQVSAWFQQEWQTIANGFQITWEAIKNVVSTVFSTVGDVIQEHIDFLFGLFETVSNSISNAFNSLKNWITGNEDSAAALEKHRNALAEFTGSTDEAIAALSKLDEIGRNKVLFEAQAGQAAAEAEKNKTFTGLKDTASRGWFGAEFTQGREWTEALQAGSIELETYQNRLQQYIAANGQYAADARKMLEQSFKIYDLDKELEGYRRVENAVTEAKQNTGGQAVNGPVSPTPPTQQVDVKTEVAGRIVVSAAPGTNIVSTQSTNPTVPITPDRGAVVGRP